MSEDFLVCPRCKCLKFYARTAEGKLIFFRVNTDFWPVPTGINPSDLSHADFSPIHCTACSWSGEIEELQANS